MKKVVVSFLIAVVMVTLVPVVGVSAKSKKKMPKDGQKMFSLTFKEWCGNGNGYWEVITNKKGKTTYRPYVLDTDGRTRLVMPGGYYVEVDGRLYYTKKVVTLVSGRTLVIMR